MAAALVGGAFLSASLDVLFDRLASPEISNLILGKKLDPKLIQRLDTTLKAVRVVLNDAEKKRFTDSYVNDWLDDLKDAVYFADDLLDEVSFKAVTQKEVSKTNLFSLSRIFNVQDREMVSRLEDIVVRLESILKLKESLNLKEIAMDTNFSYRAPSTSLDDGSRIYGRDKDKEAIIKLLLDDSSDGEEVSVIPIVGMGGVGKTTLAQSVYNDDSVKRKFDFKAWVCVSDEFDILKVTKTITEAVTRQTCATNDLNLMHLDLQDKLREKNFLVVLDDVWIEDYGNWNLLKKPFQRGMKGSKILVTTRSEKVVSVVQTVQAYHLSQLSNEDCWLVFASHACFSQDSSENTTALEGIGRKIVKKCEGLPLAAQSLGGMLRRKHDIRDWEKVLDSDIWELSESESNIIPALRISYFYLPPHLKRCFVYCALFPKDYKFHKDRLILLWMAEGLLQQPKKGKTLEEVGNEYFDYLVSRSFFQYQNDQIKYVVMHDLMHDLAIFLGRDFYFRCEELGKETKVGIKTRHMSFAKFSGPAPENLEVFGKVKFLRTFLPIYQSVANEKVPCIIVSKLKYLRVLSFCGFINLDVLPDSIAELIHLCHLDLSYTSIISLPESLCGLYNLQMLKLRSCRKLTKLPDGMSNLVKLCHLDIEGTSLEEMPRGMGKLNNLQYLSNFVVGKHEENGIKELGELSNLHGFLHIDKLENITNCSEAFGARIMDKKHINGLQLKWSSSDDCADSQIEMAMLCKLQPHQELNVLQIWGYRGTLFPEWVGSSSYNNMTRLTLSGCNNCCMLPSLGELPSLRSLEVLCFNGLETIGAGLYKNNNSSALVTPFPSLEQLEISHMPCLELWSSSVSDAFPQLKSLSIRNCPKLKGDLPNYLPALETLAIQSCELLASYLPRAPAIRSVDIVKSNKVALQELPLSLEDIKIEESSTVESLFEVISKTEPTCLRSLTLKNCSSAKSFPGGCLPASLKTLQIDDCRKLEFPVNNKHELLDSLQMMNSCDSLISFPLENLPNLKNLHIENCENLESVLVSQSLQNLSSFNICKCPKFVSFPQQGLCAPNLTEFVISNCNKLKSLPPQMNMLLKLEHLSIEKCPNIESCPKSGMPPNLRSIWISNCEKVLSCIASMDMLTSVTILGPFDGIKSFPKEGLLPASLTSLSLCNFSGLETLECNGFLHLASFQHLTIGECPKMENMEGERLPASLTKLYIWGCPLLEERCRMKHPQIWPKISDVRYKRVDGSYIW